MKKLLIKVIIIVMIKSAYGYFDDQPKLISENGNLIIESALDRNITFRFKGSGCLALNDYNLLNLIGKISLNGSSDATSSGSINILTRVAQLESQMDRNYRRRGVLQRLGRLENRTRSVIAQQIRVRNAIRRITQLEAQVLLLKNKLNENNCLSNPCENGATCTSVFNGFICKCTPNWTGTKCNEDVNECAIFVGSDLGCQNGATCHNSIGSYSCQCQQGWQGLHCTRRNVDCLTSGDRELCGHGTCIQTNGAVGYKCLCDQGWKSNGDSPACIVDVDECNDVKPHCSMDPKVQCINLPGSYMCGLCPAGFSGNGHYCADINECDLNNGGCSTEPSVPCINTKGSHYCGSCPSGWQGDGKTCSRIASNGLCTPNLCHPLARCIQLEYGPSCVCPSGYTGVGFGPYGCTQRTNYDPCTSQPCLNGGTCLRNDTSFNCKCPPGTLLPFCESDQNPCARNPCQNGGTCISRNSSFLCRCMPNFSGTTCQTETRACGGVLALEQGVLKYPPIETNYPHNSRCAWLIRTNVTKVLNVTFTNFNLEHSRECRFDWLQIHDGRSSASYMIGRFCGSDLPKGGNIISTHNYLYLWFRSDNTSAHDGFNLSWESIAPVCGGDFPITTHGTINSPGSPGHYPPNRDCEWHLTALPGKRIQLHFFTMQLEAHQTCQYDYLAIYSGSSTSSPIIEKFCNTSHPEPIISPSNELTLHFHSDEDASDVGFQIHYSVVEGIPGCGGIFTMTHGEIASPLQNGVYPKNILCEYRIQLPKDSTIQLNFIHFELEKNRNCAFDYLDIYEGATDQDPKVGRFCGDIVPASYNSLGNVLLIVFKSDWSSAHKGFRISYSLNCGGIFANESGTLYSPLYPQAYQESRTCKYLIETTVGKGILLDFLDFDIEVDYVDDCNLDSISIFDGQTDNDTLIGKYCGTENPPRAISTFNYMFLNFETDSSIAGRGFKANYSTVDITCGGIIKKLGHFIKPPTTDNAYEHNSYCKWIIDAPIGHVVQLAFTSFDLETSSDCLFDSVTVYDGVDNSLLIGKYCGSATPPIITSNSNLLTLVFAADDSNSGGGFLATYNFIESKNLCGGKYFTITGKIRSPNWPNEYSMSKDCEWLISVPTGKQVELIINTFELEDASSTCFDYLEIRNGGNSQSPLVGQFCGTNIVKQIRSFTNQIFLHFHSDSSVSRKGFDIEWDATATGCGGVLNNSPRGSITSPNYPQPYGENAQCEWRISVNPGSIIQLVFTDLDLEEHSTCLFDSIQIYDGRDSAAKLIGKYCSSGNHPVQISSTTNHIFLRMRSDISHQGRGFSLQYSTDCKREIRLHRGIIESPNFPNKYPNNLNCEWTVIAPQGNKIFVAFSELKLESTYMDSEHKTCDFDYLQIDERNGEEILRSEKYCNQMPKEFTSSSEVVVFKFVTDISGSDTDIGFHLEFEVRGCGDLFIRPMGNFSTPNYPNLYPHNTHCEWTIQTTYGSLIELTFLDFDFEASTSCDSDGLTISNSKLDLHPITKFCGSINKKPTAITSHSNEMYLHFYSDVSYSGRGFFASFRTVTSKCGGIFKIPNGFLVSPNYPMNYDMNIYCEWFLETEETHTMILHFTDFDFEESPTCEHDFIEIYDGYEKNENRRLLKTCGSQIPKDTFSSTNKMLIVMQTDLSVAAKGFNASFATACGSNIVFNETGLISVGNNINWFSRSCNWTIKAANLNERVVLTILKLQNKFLYSNLLDSLMMNYSTCFKRIKIYDGDSINAPLKQEICSESHPPPIISNGNALTISIISAYDDYNMATGFDFEAQYSLLDSSCGGTFKGKNGIIASPHYPKSYPINIECIWTLEATEGNRMLFSITMLDINLSENCNEDYLEIRNDNQSGELFGTFCGTDVPPQLPPAQKLWIKFRSDNDKVGMGFKADYTYAHHVELSGETGYITSPLYPGTVYLFHQQSYRITVKLGYTISIAFDSLIFKIDDTLAIFDGYDETATKLADIQTTPDGALVSTTNVVFITWNENSMSEAKFKLSWTQTNKYGSIETNNGTNTLDCTKNSIVYIDATKLMNISSPGYPYGYDQNQNCIWTLISRQIGYRAAVQLVDVDLEDVDGCISDYVRIMTSSDLKQYNDVEKVCKLNPTERKSYSGAPYLKMEFYSDYWTNKTGFLAVVGLSCGGPMTAPNGLITKNMTENILDAFIKNVCEWTINVRTGRTIRFNFKQLNLKTLDDGSCDGYIVIRNGVDNDSPFLGAGQYCGTNKTIISNLETISNRAFVRYYSSKRNAHRSNFALNYEEVSLDCGGSIILTNDQNNQTISSPNYPNIPNAHIECVWSIIAPNGEIVRVDFVERFDLTKTKECDQEYVELREGGIVMSHEIGKYCNTTPNTIISTSNILTIKYFTDVIIPKNGFKANVMIGKCGGFYRGNKNGIVSSPSYPGLGAYPSNSQCDYRVQSKSGSSLNITFMDIHLPDAEECNETDHIILYNVLPSDDNTEQLDEIGVYCGMDNHPPSIIVDGSELLIRFVTRERIGQYRGFQIGYVSTSEKCGGTIIAESGIITSPGYPLGKNNRKFCEWRITVPKGRRIKLEILDYDIIPLFPSTNSSVFGIRYSHMFNTHQRISVYNDHSYTSRIKYLTENDLGTPIYSSDNIMLITMWIYSNTGHRGFKFGFSSNESTICVGNLNGNSGMILSPTNISSYYCEYIRNEPLTVNKIGFGTLAIRLSEIPKISNDTTPLPCLTGIPSGVVVKYEPNAKSKSFYRQCNADGTKKIQWISSPFQNTMITMKQGFYSLFNNQYQIDYKVHQCGGLIQTNMSYALTKPTFPASYGELNCAWQFKANDNLNVQLRISHSSFNCDNEYINIYNGVYPTSPKLSRFCGNAVNQSQITLHGHSIFVEYHVDNYNQQSSFELKIESSYSVCGGILEAPIYNIKSPMNNSQYPNNAECIWEIRANRGYHIGLEFIDRFFIETSANCTKDYIEIFDMLNLEWTSMGRYCGRSLPKPFNSTGQQMKIVFRTDSQTSGDGFSINWRENCGGIFTATNEIQTLNSPRYPDPYPPNTFCNYTIITDINKLIYVKFIDFELEDTSRSCQYDNITIYKYEEYSMPSSMSRVGTYCWKDSLTYVRYKHKIGISFWSDSWIEKRGFKLEYNLDLCGGIIKNSTSISVLALPNTNSYGNHMTCYWNITAPINKKIVIRFELFDLEHNDACYMDSVEIYEGLDEISSNRKAKLCGNLTQIAPIINIQSNRGLIKFSSDSSNGYKGFTALILFVPECDKKIELTLNSPNYTLNDLSKAYDNQLDCHYTISAPVGYKISLRFDSFHLAPCQSNRNNTLGTVQACSCDYLEIRDGGGSFADLISGPLCGHVLPSTVISSREALWVRFVSDSVGSSSGFNAAVTLTESLCGRSRYNITSSDSIVTISSPGSPKYMPNIRCDWIIETNDSDVIRIHFKKIDIQQSEQCSTDNLQIIDENVHNVITAGLGSEEIFSGTKSMTVNPNFYMGKQFAAAPHLYCGSDTPPNDFYSYSNKVHIRFKTDDTIENSGFQLEASILKACHRNYTGTQGRIFSRTIEDCETYIIAPENHTISLYFTEYSFYIANFVTCTEDTIPIKIYDGSNNGDLIRSLCSQPKPEPIFTNTSILRIQFKHVDVSWVGSHGLYDITFLATDKGRGCGGQIFNYAGSFTSPLYPLNDRNYSDCKWEIFVPQNLKVALQFEEFNLGSKTTCTDNFLQIIETNQETKTEAVSRQFCGEDNPSPYKSENSKLIVRFKKTTNFAGTGWIINFMAVNENSKLQDW